MKIREIEAFALRADVDGAKYWGAASWEANGDADVAPVDAGWTAAANDRFRPFYEQGCATTVVRVASDTGLVGYGECKAPVAPTIARDIVNMLLRPALIGLDPQDIVPLWDTMYGINLLRGHSAGFFMEAIAGVDIALWDLTGKSLGAPIAKLLGGSYRSFVPVYASGVPGLQSETEDPARMVAAVQRFAADGYRGVKLGIGHGVQADLLSIEAAVEAVAGRCAILADAAGRYDLAQAQELVSGLRPGMLHWLEAPLPPDQRDAYATLAAASPVPIGSDLLVNRWQYGDYLRCGAVHIVLPDVCRAGGFTECRRISILAEAMGARCVPHMSLGGVINIAAAAHFASALPYITMMEYWAGNTPLMNTVVGPKLEPSGGYLTVPTGPGLGIEVDEEALLSHVVDR